MGDGETELNNNASTSSPRPSSSQPIDMWQRQHQPPIPEQYLPNMAPQLTRSRQMRLHPQFSSGDEEHCRVFQRPQQMQPPPPQKIKQQQQMLMQPQHPITGLEVAPHSSNPRAARNLAEKQRRDNLNTQIATMASLVPIIASGSSRKKDKISILRLTAAHLRLAYTLGTNTNEFLPRRFNGIDLESCLIDVLSGCSHFVIVLTTGGKVVYVSRHVEQHLGHDQQELMGDSLYKYVFPDDHENMSTGLTPDGNCFEPPNSDSLEEGSNSSDDSTSIAEYANFKPQRRTFCVRLSVRPNSRKECPYYQSVLISGVLRLAHEFLNLIHNGTHRRKEVRSSNNDIVFIGTARILQTKKIAELSLLEANKDEYFTRHLVDGRIIFCDHRISIVAGYMSEEVSGTSAFKFMHKDDVRWTIVALKHMYDQGNYGSSCYRLITKTGEYIYLRTHGYVEYDETTQSISSFICVNTLISEEEGKKLIADMKQRFSAITYDRTAAPIETEVVPSPVEEVANLNDIDDIDYAIHKIISDLPSPIKVDDRQLTNPLPDNQVYKAAVYSKQLPPVSVQANKIGIKNVECLNGGKGEKGKSAVMGKNIDESSSSTSHSKIHEERSYYADKKMPKIEEPLSPVSTTRTITPISENAFPLHPSETEAYSELVHANEIVAISQISTDTFTASCSGSSDTSSSFDVQTHIISGYTKLKSQPRSSSAKTNLKRPYESETDEDRVFRKKKTVNFITQDLINVDQQVSSTNKEGNFPPYIDLQPMLLSTNVEEPEMDTQSLEPLETELIDFQQLQATQTLSNPFLDNDDILSFFEVVGPNAVVEASAGQKATEKAEGKSKATSGDAEVEKLADSISSKSQIIDANVAQVQAQSDNLKRIHPKQKNQKQKIQDLQLNVQHDSGILSKQ